MPATASEGDVSSTTSAVTAVAQAAAAVVAMNTEDTTSTAVIAGGNNMNDAAAAAAARSIDTTTSLSMSLKRLQYMAGMLGSTGIFLGSLGAHALHSQFSQGGGSRVDNWRTAVQYQLFQSVTILSLSIMGQNELYHYNEQFHLMLQQQQQQQQQQQEDNNKTMMINNKKRRMDSIVTCGTIMTIGTICFSGSIYCLCLNIGSKKIFGPMTPIGGIMMISGWIYLLWI